MTSRTDADVVLGGPMSREGDDVGPSSSVSRDEVPLSNCKVNDRTLMPMLSTSGSHTDADVLLQSTSSRICRTDDTDVPMITTSPSGTRCADDIVVVTPRGVNAEVVTDPRTHPVDVSIPLNDEDPNLPLGRAEASSASSSSDSGASSDESDDENTFVEVEKPKKTKRVKKKGRVKVHPDPPGSSLSNEKSLRLLRKKCGISEEIIECGVDISTENLSYLTDFRARGLSEELKYSVTNSSGMALIAGFPSKDDHFEYRLFFAEISESTVEADCIDLVKTRWERRVKPTLPKVSKEFLAAMHKDLSSGNGTGAPIVAMPKTSTPPAPSIRARSSRPSAPKTVLPPPSSGDVAEFRRLSAERARISSSKGKGVDRVTPSKRQRVDAFPAAAVGGGASASGGDGLLRDEAYSVVKSRYYEFSLLLDCLVGDYDEDVRSRGNKLNAAKEANAALESRLDEIMERNDVLERDALALQRVKRDYDDKLAKLKSRCAKAEGETVQLRAELSSASDLQRSRIDAAVAEAGEEMTRSFAERTSEAAGLLAEIGGKVHNDMLNLTEIDANLEFIGLLQEPDSPDLPTEVKTLRGRRHPIYDAHDVFADLLARTVRISPSMTSRFDRFIMSWIPTTRGNRSAKTL
ncbi:hypothetical protein AALP_AA2G090900 [Arabis alpina]|nr:hypothetical protein AALP_AA2G090900 [Arabis alpina]